MAKTEYRIDRDGQIALILNNYGNPYVDGDTEYFNGRQWKKISEYTDGDGVLTWYPTGNAAVEVPRRYITAPADEPFYHYISRTLDMCLSASHRIVYKPEHPVKGKPLQEKTCQEIYDQWIENRHGFGGRLPLTFLLKEDSNIEIDEDNLRVAVMINADGTYRDQLVTIDGSCKNSNIPHGFNHDIFEVRVYKTRKINRCRMLLKKAGIKFCEKDIKNKKDYPNGLPGKSFKFRFPFNPKLFPSEWIYLRKELKEVFLEEIMHWDGSIEISTNIPRHDGSIGTATSKRYCSSKKQDIDLVQMIAHSCGYSTRIREDKRKKKINYILSIRSNKVTKMSKEIKTPNTRRTGRFEKVEVDRKYCFETNSCLLLRRNGKIFITGNCAGTDNLETA